MAGGGVVVTDAGSRAAQYESKTTAAVVFICIIAASGGLLFGYDLGVTGGVASLDNFLGVGMPPNDAWTWSNQDELVQLCALTLNALSHRGSFPPS
jgi:hypothetical protein